MADFTIDFEPVGRRGKCRKKEPLLACAHRLGVGISSICGGKGMCHSCKVQVLSGTVSKPTSNELETFSRREIKREWRLACQTYPASDCKVAVPAESMTTTQRTQVEGFEINVQPEPLVSGYNVTLQVPTLSESHSDASNLLETLNQQYNFH